MIKIGNRKNGDLGEYCGRGSSLGNPFSHLAASKAEAQVATRGDAVVAQGEYMLELVGRGRAIHPAARQFIEMLEPEERKKRSAAMRLQLNNLFVKAKLGDLTLICYCSPAKCHTENIKELLERVLAERGAA